MSKAAFLAAAVPALGIGMASSPSHAAEGTPDDHWVGFMTGRVMWNDYDSDFHDRDYDNIRIEDGTDSVSVKVTAYNHSNGNTYSEHVYNGDTKELDVGNVRAGDKVSFDFCTWNNGHEVGCDEDEHWFRE